MFQCFYDVLLAMSPRLHQMSYSTGGKSAKMTTRKLWTYDYLMQLRPWPHWFYFPFSFRFWTILLNLKSFLKHFYEDSLFQIKIGHLNPCNVCCREGLRRKDCPPPPPCVPPQFLLLVILISRAVFRPTEARFPARPCRKTGLPVSVLRHVYVIVVFRCWMYAYGNCITCSVCYIIRDLLLLLKCLFTGVDFTKRGKACAKTAAGVAFSFLSSGLYV